LSKYGPWTRPSNQRRYAQHRAVYNRIKQERGCDRCGYNEHYSALEWDHRDGENKRFGLGMAVGLYSWQAVVAEMEKCDLLCANCHRLITESRRRWGNGTNKPSRAVDEHPRLFGENT
jgi:hypothetical protein